MWNAIAVVTEPDAAAVGSTFHTVLLQLQGVHFYHNHLMDYTTALIFDIHHQFKNLYLNQLIKHVINSQLKFAFVIQWEKYFLVFKKNQDMTIFTTDCRMNLFWANWTPVPICTLYFLGSSKYCFAQIQILCVRGQSKKIPNFFFKFIALLTT